MSAIGILAFFGILLEVAGGTSVASEPSVSSIHLLLFPEYNALVSLNASAPCQERVHEQDLASDKLQCQGLAFLEPCSTQSRMKRNT